MAILVLLTLICLLGAYGYSLLRTALRIEPLRQVFFGAPQPASLSAFADLISVMALMLLILITNVLFERQASFHDAASESAIASRGAIRGWIAGFVAGLVFVVGIVIFVNPRALYGTNIFLPRVYDSYTLKARYYEALPQPPQVIVLGTSRAEQIMPDYISRRLGYTAFNGAVAGSTVRYFSAFMKYILEKKSGVLPEVFLIEVRPDLIGDSVAVVQAPLGMFPYLLPQDQAQYVQARAEGLLDRYQLSEAFYVLAQYKLVGPPPPRYIRPNGAGVGPVEITPDQLEAQLNDHIEHLPPPMCAELPQPEVSLIEEIIALAEAKRTSLVFYISPNHPRYYYAVMQDNVRYRQCHSLFEQFMQEQTRRHENVFFLDFTQNESIHGLDGADGYRDSHHLTVENSNRLIDAASQTINAAYQIAAKRRGERLSVIPSSVRVEFDGDVNGRNWYPPEVTPDHKTITWTGPGREATLNLAISPNRLLEFQVCLLQPAAPIISLNDQPMNLVASHDSDCAYLFSGYISPAILARRQGYISITLGVEKTVTPHDIDPRNMDTRSLGLCLDWLTIKPVDNCGSQNCT